MGKPLVSIILTLYNGKRFIHKTIESALAQTYTDWEMIVVNDASTDGSADIISSFDDPRIRIVSLEENGQLCNAHIVGDGEAKGKYMAVLDKDDLWEPDKLEKQVAYLEEHPDTGVCFTMMSFIDENGQLKEDAALQHIFTAPNRSRAEWIHELLTTGNHLCHPSALVRMDALREAGDYRMLYLQVQDYDLWLRIALKHNLYVIQEPLVRYRRFDESGSLSQKNRENDRRVFFEYAWIVGNTVTDMEPELFRRVFHRELRDGDAETENEILCEKALLLASDVLVVNSKRYAFDLFQRIFQDPEARKVLKEHYGITQHDVYRMTGNPINYDRTTETEIRELEHEIEEKQLTINHKQNLLELSEAQAKQREAELEQVIAEKDRKIEDYIQHVYHTGLQHQNEVNTLKGQINELNALYRKSASDLAEIQGAFFWRITAPARKMMIRLKTFVSGHEKLYLAARLGKCLIRQGPKETVNRYRAYKKEEGARKLRNQGYYVTAEEVEKKKQESYSKDILFSILVPLYNTPEKYLTAMIDSVIGQSYEKWELCLADGSDAEHGYVRNICEKYAKKDARIKYRKLEKNGGISENTNACLEMATGDYIGLFDHDDLLHPFALSEYMRKICDEDADFLYSDEYTFHETPKDAYWPNYKPDYAPDTLRSYNYICHFTVFEKALLEQAGGGFRKEYDGSQDYDLILRLTEKAKHIVHVPEVLYYWRSHPDSTASDIAAKPYTMTAAKKAIAAHLERTGLKGKVLDSVIPSTYKVQYEIRDNPLISIIIPNKDHIDDLDKCLKSIREKSTYTNWEAVIVENNSTEQATFDYYDTLRQDERIRVIRWEREFNYSAINNFGVKEARGDYLLLLNNDIEVITPDWMEQMLMFVQREDVGAAGAMLYYPDDTVQHAGVILGIGGVAGHAHKYFKRGDYGYASRMTIAQDLSAVTAACILIDRKVWDEVQGLDEGFAVAFNDVDLCMKIRKAGYLIVWTPYAELYHYESKSRGLEDNPEKQKRFKGEIDRFFSKWSEELAKGDPYYNPNLTLVTEDFAFKDQQ